MKAEVVMNHDMERKLQQHSDEIVKLIKDVKFKVKITRDFIDCATPTHTFIY